MGGAYSFVARVEKDVGEDIGSRLWNSLRPSFYLRFFLSLLLLSFTRVVFYPFEDDEKSACDM